MAATLVGLFTRRPCPSLSRVARAGGRLGFKLSFSLRSAKNECFCLLFKREGVKKVSSAYARCQRCQVHMQGVRNGVKGIRESVMSCE